MTADKISLKVQKRTITGRKTKKLRRDGILPANVYGKDVKSVSVKLALKDFTKTFSQAGETNIINLTIDKEAKTRPVLVHNIHVHPVTDEFLHVDFHQVDLTKKATVDIPIELKGEAPAVSKGGILIQLTDEVQVEALPADLPDKFEIDISKLEEIGQGISLKKIKVDAKVKLMVENLDELVVKIEEPTKEEEKPVEEVAEGEEGEEAETAEGEEVKEGEEKPEAKEGDSKEKPAAPKDDKKETKKPADK